MGIECYPTLKDLTPDTLRPSSRLVVGRRGSAGLIGVTVPHGVERFRFAAAAIPDRFVRCGFTCIAGIGFGFVWWA